MQDDAVIVFDIDGTLADIRHRRFYLDQNPPDWRKFNAAMGDDVLNEPIVRLYKTLWDIAHYELVLVTGRSEKFRNITEQWLIWNEIPFRRLLMRSDGDQRADYLVKQDIHDLIVADTKQISFVVDDRQQVVDMWRRNGVTCLQCDVGAF